MPNTDNTCGRQSPRLQEQQSGNISDAQLKQLILHIKLQNDEIIANQKTFMQRLEANSAEIDMLKAENCTLRTHIDVLNEKLIKLDQYSRKDVAIMTGLSFDPNSETQSELETNVVNTINRITGKNTTIQDYSAIHRNGRKNKRNGRPPSVTIKFLRLRDKDLLFTRNVITKRKQLYNGINFHHCLSEGMISIQNEIASNECVKFVNYMGPGRNFSVCIKRSGKDDTFLNRIESVAQFNSELENLEC